MRAQHFPGAVRRTDAAGQREDIQKQIGQATARAFHQFACLSERLLYSDAERKASFFDHVEVIGSTGDLFADHVDIFLTPRSAYSHDADCESGGKRRKDFLLTATMSRSLPSKGL